jgi:hypothetical protein
MRQVSFALVQVGFDTLHCGTMHISVGWSQICEPLLAHSSASRQLFELPPEPPMLEPPAAEPPVLDPPVADPPVLEPPALEPPTLEPTVLEPPTLEPPTLEPPGPEPTVAAPPEPLVLELLGPDVVVPSSLSLVALSPQAAASAMSAVPAKTNRRMVSSLGTRWWHGRGRPFSVYAKWRAVLPRPVQRIDAEAVTTSPCDRRRARTM